MLEARIEMSLQAEIDDDWVVVAVDVSVDTVQALEDLKNERLEGFGESYAYNAVSKRRLQKDHGKKALTYSAWEHLLIVDTRLYPRNKMLDVLRCRHLRRLLEILIVLPQVFEFIRSLHLRTALRGAELGDAAVKEIDLIIEVDNCPKYVSTSGMCRTGEERNIPFTASHSFSSSPSGNFTAFFKL